MRRILLLCFLILLAPLAAAPTLRPDQTMVLVVGPWSKPVSDEEKLVVVRLNELRKQAHLNQLLLATMHYDQAAQAKLCRDVLGIAENDLICLAVVQLDPKTRRPVKTLYKLANVSQESLDSVEVAVRRWASVSGVKMPEAGSLPPPGNPGGGPNLVALNGSLDFNGDGKTDVLAIKNNVWLVSYGGTGTYTTLRVQPGVRLDQMAFGDFDGDGKTDVLVADGGPWRISLGGTADLTPLNSLTVGTRYMKIADIDGDGRSDVFHTTGREWHYSSGGSKPWTPLQPLGIPVENVGLGDFDGDGKADALISQNREWRLSSGCSAAPVTWNRSQSDRPEFLRVADYTGDGKVDVLTARDGNWLMSDNGRTPYQKVNNQPGIGLAYMGPGDFNGDGKWDIFCTKDNGRWAVSWGATSPLEVINGDTTVKFSGLRF